MPLDVRSGADRERAPEHPRRFRLKTRLWLTAAVAAALVLAFFLGGLSARREERAPVITNELLGQRLSQIEELATVEYHYTNMGKFENQMDFYGWKVPFTTKSFIVAYDGVIKAGVDLSQLQVEVQGNDVAVTLPAARIFSHEIDEDSLEIFDETRNLFNPIQIGDYTGFTKDQKDAIEARAIENGLLTAADQQAAESVKRLLTMIDGMENYTLTVESVP
ncbi:DUF4230 domain-containing protein [Pseudoflavonifractor sp. 524-17]|uniref:DUF4230 domain-containing protein n=1 Tax=Pseudoflavonifractor sp. 524-17 TaxID=2304577 RepID=UPI001379FFDB|nr:DUF4230 domain-containing protein [Pseudoflavonifractor sp. 524-17]NCE65644.1 DUF4230 domain-containing protein [Pseudoflavonifractor sp. 524-17]